MTPPKAAEGSLRGSVTLWTGQSCTRQRAAFAATALLSNPMRAQQKASDNCDRWSHNNSRACWEEDRLFFPGRDSASEKLSLLQPCQLPFAVCKGSSSPALWGLARSAMAADPELHILCWSRISPFSWRNVWPSVCFRSTKGRELTRSGDPGRLRKANYPRDTAEWTLVDTSQADQMQDYKDPKDQE